MNSTVYDAGVLIAAERNERRVWAEHRVRLEAGFVPAVPAPVVAQVSRSTRQVQLRRFLSGCEVVAFDEAAAHRVGTVLGKAGTSDIVDGAVVELAMARGADVVTDDVAHIRKLAAAVGLHNRIMRP